MNKKISAKNKNYGKLREKCVQLIETNKQLSNKCRQLSAELTIKHRHCYALNSTVDLYQKLVQHLKTELSLLRSAQELNQGLNASEPPLPICDVSDINTTDNNASNVTNTSGDVYACDHVANGYEEDIKLFKLECDVLSNETLICFEVNATEQLLANQLLSDNDEDDDNDDNDAVNGDDTDLLSNCDNKSDINAKSSKTMRQSNADNDDTDIDESVKSGKTRHSSFKDDMESVKSDGRHDHKSSTKCSFCGRKFDTETESSEHKSMHKIGDKIKCLENDCNFKCESKHDFKEHIRYHKRNKAKTEPTIHMPLKIRLTSTPTQSGKKIYDITKTFKCLKCNKEMPSMMTLKLHQKSVHNITSSFVCKYCGDKFEKVLDLRSHEQIHKNPGNVIQSNESVKQNSIINGHKESSLPSDTSRSQSLPANTLKLDLNSFDDNKETTAQKVSPIDNNLNSSSEPQISPYFANITQSIDNTIPANAVAVEDLSAVNTRKLYPCEMCGRTLLSQSGLATHIKMKHKNDKDWEIAVKNEKTAKPRKKVKTDGEENLDMSQRLTILNMFYAEQQKQVIQ